MTLYQTHVAHLVNLYADPGFRLYSKARANELEGCRSGIWAGIVDAMKAEIARQEVVASIGPKNIKGVTE